LQQYEQGSKFGRRTQTWPTTADSLFLKKKQTAHMGIGRVCVHPGRTKVSRERLKIMKTFDTNILCERTEGKTSFNWPMMVRGPCKKPGGPCHGVLKKILWGVGEGKTNKKPKKKKQRRAKERYADLLKKEREPKNKLQAHFITSPRKPTSGEHGRRMAQSFDRARLTAEITGGRSSSANEKQTFPGPYMVGKDESRRQRPQGTEKGIQIGEQNHREGR